MVGFMGFRKRWVSEEKMAREVGRRRGSNGVGRCEGEGEWAGLVGDQPTAHRGSQQGQGREEGDQRQRGQQRHVVGNHLAQHVLHANLGNVGHEEERQAHGRRDEADHQVEHHHHAQVHRVHARGQQRLGEDGGDHEDGRRAVKEHADHEQQQPRHRLRHLLHRQHPAEQGGHRHDE